MPFEVIKNMIFQFFILIFDLLLIFYLIFLFLEFLNFSIRKIPPVPTSSRVIEVIIKILETKKGKKRTFVDLGCGMGKVLIALKNRFPEMEVLGYENSPSQFLLLKIKSFFLAKKIKVFFKDLFKADLRNVDIVYCYLWPNLMERLEKKFEKELKPEALIITNTFPLPNWQPTQIILTNQENPNCEKLFIYEKRKSIE